MSASSGPAPNGPLQSNATTTDDRAATEAEVIAEEIAAEIEPRRRAAFGTPVVANGNTSRTLVGLALSGGGIRSAAFCLGILREFAARRFLPFVDYLSTVSGGGYAGVYLSTEILRSSAPVQDDGRARLPFDISQTAFAEKPVDLGHRPTGRRQTSPFNLLHFIHGGKYLVRPWEFSSRHLIGWALVFGTVCSGLMTVAAGTAWLFRLLDGRECRYWVDQLGFHDDLRLAFVPSFFLLLAWGITWLVSYFKYQSRATGEVARYVFYALVFCTGVAVAALIGTGDIDIKSIFQPGAGATDEVKSRAPSSAGPIVNTLKDKIWYIVFSALLASLLPYLNPKRLFQSGVAPQSVAEKMIFKVATRALVYGVPFAAIAWFASENISGWNDHRPALIDQMTEINDWSGADARLWQQLFSEKRIPNSPGQAIIAQINGSAPQADGVAPADGRLEEMLEKLEVLNRDFQLRDERLSALAAWRQLIRYPLDAVTSWLDRSEDARTAASAPKDSDRLADFVDSYRNVEKQQTEIARLLNVPLKNPELFRSFEPRASKGEGDAPEEALLRRHLERPSVVDAVTTARGIYERWLRIRDVFRPDSDEFKHFLDYEVADANRHLLDVYYPNSIHPQKAFVSSYVVWSHDQKTRLAWFFASAGVFVLLCLFVDLNATSWHGFYSNQIATMWMQPVPGLERRVPLARLDTTSRGGPYHLISGTVQMLGKRDRSEETLPRDHFLFSKRFFGSTRTGFACPADHDSDALTLANAVAVSGAAISPTQANSNMLVAVLLFLSNIRLGQWIINPGRQPWWPQGWFRRFESWPVTPFRFLISLLKKADQRTYCFVTDGGHCENLGIEALLRRRCRLIIAADASQDSTYAFADLDHLICWARLNHGIEFVPIDPRETSLPLHELRCASTREPGGLPPFSPSHYVIAEIRYPDEESRRHGRSYLIYLKSSLTGDEPRDILGFAQANSEFPHDSTADQMFEPERFETYRQLGQHVARSTLDRVFGSVPDGVGPGHLVACVDRLAIGLRISGRRNPLEILDWIVDFTDTAKHAHVREAAGGRLLDWLERHPEQFVNVSQVVSVLEDDDDEVLRKQADEILRRGGIGCLEEIAAEGLVLESPARATAVAQALASIATEAVQAGDVLRLGAIEAASGPVIERLKKILAGSATSHAGNETLAAALNAAILALEACVRATSDAPPVPEARREPATGPNGAPVGTRQTLP